MKNINFAENLKMLRKSKRMTQAELASLLGVGQRTISDWETIVSEPGFSMLAKLCDIFDENFDNILT